MSEFFETTFGPAELEILESVLERWCAEREVPKHSAEATLAAEIFINLFREGNKTVPELQEAASRHKWLTEGSIGA